MMNNRFYNFPRITVAVYFTECESIIVYRSTRRAGCLSEKAYITSAFESMGLMGVSAPSLHIEIRARASGCTYYMRRWNPTSICTFKTPLCVFITRHN